MAAPVLQRSSDTFRRNGSSGLVWEDRYFSEDLNLSKTRKQGPDELMTELRPSHSVGLTIGQMERSRRTTINATIAMGGGSGSTGSCHPYRSSMVSPAVDPPSPKHPVCGFFGFLGNSGTASGKASKPGRR